jgi:RNA polymerase sigma-70 factor (ECF subfamily)
MAIDTDSLSDQELVEQAKSSEAAFRALYGRYYDKIYRFVVKRVSHRETAEDIVSCVFERTFLHLSDWKWQGYHFGAWLYRVAGNLVIDHYRGKARRYEVDLEQAPEVPDANNDDAKESVEREETRKIVHEALEKIPEKYANILSMKFFGELSNQEIAKALGVTANHVGVLIYRALKKCAKVMKEDARFHDGLESRNDVEPPATILKSLIGFILHVIPLKGR